MTLQSSDGQRECGELSERRESASISTVSSIGVCATNGWRMQNASSNHHLEDDIGRPGVEGRAERPTQPAADRIRHSHPCCVSTHTPCPDTAADATLCMYSRPSGGVCSGETQHRQLHRDRRTDQRHCAWPRLPCQSRSCRRILHRDKNAIFNLLCIAEAILNEEERSTYLRRRNPSASASVERRLPPIHRRPMIADRQRHRRFRIRARQQGRRQVLSAFLVVRAPESVPEDISHRLVDLAALKDTQTLDGNCARRSCLCCLCSDVPQSVQGARSAWRSRG